MAYGLHSGNHLVLANLSEVNDFPVVASDLHVWLVVPAQHNLVRVVHDGACFALLGRCGSFVVSRGGGFEALTSLSVNLLVKLLNLDAVCELWCAILDASVIEETVRAAQKFLVFIAPSLFFSHFNIGVANGTCWATCD